MTAGIVEFLKIFIPLFVVIDPFGAMLIFMGLTSGMNHGETRVVTMDAVIYGFIILLFFALLGNYLLYFFGITIQAIEIAGGAILLIMGINMVREGDRPSSAGGNVEKDIGIVPMATPLLAGPGAISLVIILMNGGYYNLIFTIISLVLVFVIIFLFFEFSERILSLMGAKVLKAMTRVLGLLVAGFAIQYILDAISIIATTLH
ncbi:MAG: MarC family protein [Thermoplasmata archaeon]